ncbi:hypothetical protein AALO_G00242380, partial [Alosa alosa]
PQGLGPLSVVAVSESFLAVSWQPPSRPNGPNIRFELLRRKAQEPLASHPPEDLNLWYNVYAGAKLFHQDKGLSRFTQYQYKLLVHNDVGYSSGEIATASTLAGVPRRPSSISSLTVSHTSILVNWTTPTLEDLQGEVVSYTLWVNSSQGIQALTFDPEVTSALVPDLQPSTVYNLTLQVFNGAHNATSAQVTCTTEDGEPEGVFPPEVVTLNSTTVRVLWAEPLVPNGAITQYGVYVDDQLRGTAGNTTGSLELGDLLPFTVYDIQVEVCTVYACVRSNVTRVTTVEDLPGDITAPHIQVLGSRSVRLEWSSPGQPNGILLGYDVRRRALRQCEELRVQLTLRPTGRCSLLRCPKPQRICGSACYHPQEQVCCGETVYTRDSWLQCCGERYVPVRNASESVCCGDQLFQTQPQHQCCGRYYVRVPPGEVCCPNPEQMRVSVGLGDACCGGNPFSWAAGQLCCGGSLHDGYQAQCCGAQVVSQGQACCGDAQTGTAYTPVPGMSCCGELYINSSETLCCGGAGLEFRAHHLNNDTVTWKCCGSE